MPQYRYPLLKEATDIRILTLYPATGDAELQGILSPRMPNEDYEALSWHWGDEDETEAIFIKQEGHWYNLPIRPNLASALKQLRHPNVEMRKLWIDAICIDQDSIAEKNAQVPMMAAIYSQAKNVCVWLGEEKDESGAALKFIKDRILDLGSFDELVDDEKTPPEWAALSALMARPWFSRRWVGQENALAKDATLHCGGDW